MSRKRAVYVVSEPHDVFFLWSPTMGLTHRRAWSARYDLIDYMMGRPIHIWMSVAPPWARKLSKKNRYRKDAS